MMKKPVKISAVAGITLFVLAALFAISLLSVFFDYGTMSPVHDTFFLNFGKMISGVYGFSSVLIPLFLIVAGIECFTSNWSVRKGFVLLGSVVPFFTVHFCEKICRRLIETSDESELSVKLFAALVVGVLAVAAEYIILSIIGKFFEKDETEEKTVKFEKAEESVVTEDVYEEPAEKEIFEEETVNEVPFDAEADEPAENEEEKTIVTQEFSPATGNFEPNPFDHVFDTVENSQMVEEAPHYYENPEPIEYKEEKIADDAETFEAAGEEISDADIDFDPEKLEAETYDYSEEYEEPVPQSVETEEIEFDEPAVSEETEYVAEEVPGSDESNEEINDEEQDFLAKEVKVDKEDEIDIISEFENNAAIETEHLDDTIEVDPAFFGVDLNADESTDSEEEDVFAMMDQDAAKEPMLDNGNMFENDIILEDPTIQEGVSEDLPEDCFDEELTATDSDVMDDYEFERIWNDCERYIPILKNFKYVISPDFSVWDDMTRAMQIYNTYRNRALAWYLMVNGVNIIPCVEMGGADTWDFVFDGLPKHGTIALSTNGGLTNDEAIEGSIKSMNKMMEVLEPTKLVIVGRDIGFKTDKAEVMYFDSRGQQLAKESKKNGRNCT